MCAPAHIPGDDCETRYVVFVEIEVVAQNTQEDFPDRASTRIVRSDLPDFRHVTYSGG